jgi:hypothetical protein
MFWSMKLNETLFQVNQDIKNEIGFFHVVFLSLRICLLFSVFILVVCKRVVLMASKGKELLYRLLFKKSMDRVRVRWMKVIFRVWMVHIVY